MPISEAESRCVAAEPRAPLERGFPGARRFRQLLSADIHKAAEPLKVFDQAAELMQGR
jgi:hypothetical protein